MRRSRGALAAGVAALGIWAAGARAQAAEASRPTLVVALYAKPADRSALRRALAGEQAGRLASWRARGMLAGYRLLFTRYADSGVWDGLEVLTFRDDAALARWDSIERTGAGGLAPGALAHVQQVATTPADALRQGRRTPAAPAPTFLVVPYEALVPIPEYLKYLDGYTLPQFDGWMSAGVLDGYDIAVSRYPAGRPWASLILLRYHDDAALARRDETTAKVRAQLANDPAWKAIADNKKAIRAEKAAAVAEQLAAGGEP